MAAGAEQLIPTSVHHTLPESYVRNEAGRPRLDKVVPDVDIPVVDLADPDRAAVVSQIAAACRSHGFFQCQVLNHGLPVEVIQATMEVAQDLFWLSPEEKKARLYSDDPAKETVHNWRDYLRLHCHPVEQFVPDWPANPPPFMGKIEMRSSGFPAPMAVDEMERVLRGFSRQDLAVLSRMMGKIEMPSTSCYRPFEVVFDPYRPLEANPPPFRLPPALPPTLKEINKETYEEYTLIMRLIVESTEHTIISINEEEDKEEIPCRRDVEEEHELHGIGAEAGITDSDGGISRRELAMRFRMFDADADADGRISRSELAALFEHAAPAAAELSGMMAEADAHGDGFIGLDETAEQDQEEEELACPDDDEEVHGSIGAEAGITVRSAGAVTTAEVARMDTISDDTVVITIDAELGGSNDAHEEERSKKLAWIVGILSGVSGSAATAAAIYTIPRVAGAGHGLTAARSRSASASRASSWPAWRRCWRLSG